MKSYAISIPKPCHEDWNKMTPDAKGAFCASCQKSVYDFSNKSDEEIISVFEKEGKGKVCGRFAPAQLSRPVVSFVNKSSSSSRLAIFACALLLVFGATLFNGVEAFGQDVKGDVKVQVMGEPYMYPIKPVEAIVKDTVVKKVCGTKKIVNEFPTMLGDVDFVEEPVILVNGNMMITEIPLDNPLDTVILMEDSLDVVEVVESVLYETMSFTTGLSVIEIVELPELINPVDEQAEEEPIIENESVSILPKELEIKVSPNPSSGEIILSYNLETVMPLRIDLFDISGKLVRTLTQQANQYPGKYNVSYNIADLPNGIYNVMLLSADRKTSAKVVLNK